MSDESADTVLSALNDNFIVLFAFLGLLVLVNVILIIVIVVIFRKNQKVTRLLKNDVQKLKVGQKIELRPAVQRGDRQDSVVNSFSGANGDFTKLRNIPSTTATGLENSSRINNVNILIPSSLRSPTFTHEHGIATNGSSFRNVELARIPDIDTDNEGANATMNTGSIGGNISTIDSINNRMGQLQYQYGTGTDTDATDTIPHFGASHNARNRNNSSNNNSNKHSGRVTPDLNLSRLNTGNSEIHSAHSYESGDSSYYVKENENEKAARQGSPDSVIGTINYNIKFTPPPQQSLANLQLQHHVQLSQIQFADSDINMVKSNTGTDIEDDALDLNKRKQNQQKAYAKQGKQEKQWKQGKQIRANTKQQEEQLPQYAPTLQSLNSTRGKKHGHHNKNRKSQSQSHSESQSPPLLNSNSQSIKYMGHHTYAQSFGRNAAKRVNRKCHGRRTTHQPSLHHRISNQNSGGSRPTSAGRRRRRVTRRNRFGSKHKLQSSVIESPKSPTAQRSLPSQRALSQRSMSPPILYLNTLQRASSSNNVFQPSSLSVNTRHHQSNQHPLSPLSPISPLSATPTSPPMAIACATPGTTTTCTSLSIGISTHNNHSNHGNHNNNNNNYKSNSRIKMLSPKAKQKIQQLKLLKQSSSKSFTSELSDISARKPSVGSINNNNNNNNNDNNNSSVISMDIGERPLSKLGKNDCSLVGGNMPKNENKDKNKQAQVTSLGNVGKLKQMSDSSDVNVIARKNEDRRNVNISINNGVGINIVESNSSSNLISNDTIDMKQNSHSSSLDFNGDNDNKSDANININSNIPTLSVYQPSRLRSSTNDNNDNNDDDNDSDEFLSVANLDQVEIEKDKRVIENSSTPNVGTR